MMEIRRASIFDCSQIYAMLCKMHEEAEFELGAIDSKKLSEAVASIMNNGVVFLAVEDGQAIGSIGGTYTSEWWSEEIIFGDLWFYVYKDKRSTAAGIGLIKKFIEAGKGMKIKLGHIYNGDLDRKDKFYERLGLQKAGSTYVKENL